MMGFCLAVSNSNAGVRDGGGGSLVLENGKLEPADLHYNGQTDVIPATYVPVNFKNYPQAVEALNYAMAFLKGREINDHEGLFTDWDMEDTEFYFVPKLSGDDLLPVKPGMDEIQVAFTRDIVDPTNDPLIRPIVELLQGPFDQLEPRYQALVLLHELMHHKPYGQHVVISPIIESLNVLLPLKHLQDAGDRSPLTDQQFNESQKLEKLMSAFEHAPAMNVTRNGGGLWEGVEPKGDHLFIGVTSTLSEQYSNGSISNGILIDSHVTLDNCGKVNKNTFVRSNIDIKCSALAASYPQAYQMDDVLQNQFTDSDLKIDMTFFVGDFTKNIIDQVRTKFENLGASSTIRIEPRENKPNSPITISENVFRSITANQYINLIGSKNVISNIHQGEDNAGQRIINIQGDGNKVSDLNAQNYADRSKPAF